MDFLDKNAEYILAALMILLYAYLSWKFNWPDSESIAWEDWEDHDRLNEWLIYGSEPPEGFEDERSSPSGPPLEDTPAKEPLAYPWDAAPPPPLEGNDSAEDGRPLKPR